MASAKDAVNTVIKDGLHPHLRRAGYRKSGRTYRLDASGVTQIVSVNRSVRELPGLGTIGNYGVELGLYFPGVYLIGQGEETPKPTIHECYVHGGLPADGWGAFDDIAGNQPSVEQQTAALERVWLADGEAWFARYREPRSACNRAIEKEDFTEALYFSIYLEDWALASEMLERCRGCLGGEWIVYIEDVARRHGVPGAK